MELAAHFATIIALLSTLLLFIVLLYREKKAHEKTQENLKDAIVKLRDRPNSVELDEFIHDLSTRGRGVIAVSAIRIDEILLRAEPRYD